MVLPTPPARAGRLRRPRGSRSAPSSSTPPRPTTLRRPPPRAAGGDRRGGGVLRPGGRVAGWLYAWCWRTRSSRRPRRRVLVVGVEKLSTVCRADPSTGPLFGDGAGRRCWAGGGAANGAVHLVVGGRAAGGRLKRPPAAPAPFRRAGAGGALAPAADGGDQALQAAVRTMARRRRSALCRRGGEGGGEARVPHQATCGIIEVDQGDGPGPGARLRNIDRIGNTGSATIPIALDEGLARGPCDGDAPILLVSSAPAPGRRGGAGG